MDVGETESENCRDGLLSFVVYGYWESRACTLQGKGIRAEVAIDDATGSLASERLERAAPDEIARGAAETQKKP